MGQYVQVFIGPPGLPEKQIVADVGAATGLVLARSELPSHSFRGSDGGRGVLLIAEPNTYDDEPYLPSFADHPYELEFYTAPKDLESEQQFLDETFRHLRATGRYDLFATLDLQRRIDPD